MEHGRTVATGAPRASVRKVSVGGMGLPLSHARIDKGIQHVRNRIAREYKCGATKRDTHEQGRVTAQTCRHRRLTQPRIGKHLFDQYRASKNLSNRGELKRQGGQNQIAKTMAQQNVATRFTASTRKANVIALQHVNDLFTRMEGDAGKSGDREGEHR